MDQFLRNEITKIHARLNTEVLEAGGAELEKFETWEAIISVGLEHIDEVLERIREDKGIENKG